MFWELLIIGYGVCWERWGWICRWELVYNEFVWFVKIFGFDFESNGRLWVYFR